MRVRGCDCAFSLGREKGEVGGWDECICDAV